MMMNTHKMLAKRFIEDIDEDKVFLINEGHFIWGNLKPDSVSKYKFKKHYIDESLEMIVEKIQFLSSLTLDDIYNKYSISKFNQELGVVCHFLCDYFCIPHFQRWEFKNATIVREHVSYENELNKFAKDYNIIKDLNLKLTSKEIRDYIIKMQEEYGKVESYEQDLIFSSHICSSVINTVLNEIMINQRLKNMKYLVI